MSGSLRTALLTWDWRGQPDLDSLSRLLSEVSDGSVHLRQVDTGSDEYAIVLSSEPLTDGQAQGIWSARGEGE